MSAIQNIKRAAERLLLTITPAIPTAFEGVDFDPPPGMYQRCQFRIDDPTDPTFPAGYHRENIEFQVFISGLKGEGTADVLTRADLIRQTFYKSLTMTEGSTRIYILRTPKIGSAIPIQDRLIVPVLISLSAEVYS